MTQPRPFKHIDRRLRFRLRIYLLLSLILLGVIGFNIFRGDLNIWYGLLAMGIGVMFGVISSRMFRTSWDDQANQVISRMDKFGIAILIAYIVVEFNRTAIVRYVTHNVQVAPISFSILAGIMIGRFIGTRGRIINVLKEQKIF